MTEENHCYENAMAERVNGILKDEFFLDQIFDNWLTQRELQTMQLIYTLK
jgi:transposase InsO family protein